LALASFLLFCVIVIPCHAPGREALCRNGNGNFEAEFQTGVKLRLGAARKNCNRTRDTGLCSNAQLEQARDIRYDRGLAA
jgi:hypothetical protein